MPDTSGVTVEVAAAKPEQTYRRRLSAWRCAAAVIPWLPKRKLSSCGRASRASAPPLSPSLWRACRLMLKGCASEADWR